MRGRGTGVGDSRRGARFGTAPVAGPPPVVVGQVVHGSAAAPVVHGSAEQDVVHGTVP